MWSTVTLLAMVMEQSTTTQPDYSAAIALHAGRGTPLTRKFDALSPRAEGACGAP